MSQWIDFLTGNFVSGLLGAVIGGGASIGGARMQAKASDRTARDTAAKAAAQEAYDLLGELRSTLAGRAPVSSPEDRAAWNREQRAMVLRAWTGVNLLPESEDARRTRCRKVLRLIEPFDDHVTWDDYVFLTTMALSDVMGNLGTYVSGRPIPEHDDVKGRIEAERKRRRRMELGRRLVALEEEHERYGLSPEGQQLAEEIKAELGVQHSRELAAEELAAITS
ncbi:hypothetical protein [Streptomyces griseoluteus]|uniref:hypothetical protein n=1 Tax=Streptomyces griseoluteus TaxID=29306 RepID=UPI003802CA1E